MDAALRRQLEARLGDHLTGPVAGRGDETEIRIEPGSATSVLGTLHDDPDLRFRMLVDLAGVDTGDHFQVVYHLWSDASPDWLRVIVEPLPRDDPRAPTATFIWKGAEWMER
jgi:NADH:ubiquinone oxidoreductase subunit C